MQVWELSTLCNVFKMHTLYLVETFNLSDSFLVGLLDLAWSEELIKSFIVIKNNIVKIAKKKKRLHQTCVAFSLC